MESLDVIVQWENQPTLLFSIDGVRAFITFSVACSRLTLVIENSTKVISTCDLNIPTHSYHPLPPHPLTPPF